MKSYETIRTSALGIGRAKADDSGTALMKIGDREQRCKEEH